jgi:hypothetical protein
MGQAHADHPEQSASRQPRQGQPGAVARHREVVRPPDRPDLSPASALSLQTLVGNSAVVSLVAPSATIVQRAEEKKPLEEVLAGKDPSLLKPHRPFTSIGLEQGRKICRLVIDHKFLWVGRDDEITLESAWRAMAPHQDQMTDKDWALW